MTVPRVAFQGEPGAFSEEAVLAYFGDAIEPVPVPTWRAVFEAVRDGTVAAGVAAIESSLAGSIRETYDLLSEFYDDRVRIVGEVSVPVRLALLALPGERLDRIERVYSHAQGLAQADEFLRGRDWQVMTAYNTAGAARMVAERRESGAAAVASPRVAAIYGLAIVADGIQTGDDNRTRFAVLGRELPAGVAGAADGPSTPGAPTALNAARAARAGRGSGGGLLKTTLVFAVRNVPGSLNRCLAAFADRGVNLSRLESRPARTARWEYVFWVDLDADSSDPVCAAALDDLRGQAQMVRVLGTYVRALEE